MSNPEQEFLPFLKTPTPKAWLEYAAGQLPLLLIDHAHCERKAASSALQFMSKYPQKKELIEMMSPLAREELLHFEKVLALMEGLGIALIPLRPSNYALSMHRLVTSNDLDDRLRDQLVIGAIIEARSCERFQALVPYLEDLEMKRFYSTLVKAEARHFQDYLGLAQRYYGDIDARIELFLAVENEFILAEDEVFRFHSGVPRI